MRDTILIWRPADDSRAGYLVDRTRRSVEATGWEADVQIVVGESLRDALRSVRGSVFVLRAGVWFREGSSVLRPPASSTGRPVVALGMVDPRGHGSLNDSAVRWNRLVATGELEWRDVPRECPWSLWLPSSVVERLAAEWGTERSLGEALSFLAAKTPSAGRSGDLRGVHFSPLDVAFDGRVRVLQVVTSLQRGGAERMVLDLCAELPRLGVMTLVATIGRPTREAFPCAIPTIDLSREPDRASRVERLSEVAIVAGIDLFHTHLLDGEESRLLGDRGVPVVTTVHNEEPGWPAGLIHTAGQADSKPLFVACSAAVERDLLEHLDRTQVRTVWNGIQTAAYRPSAERAAAASDWRQRWGAESGDIILLSVANPRRQKRLHLLPAVLHETRRLLRERGDARQARLVLCGEFQQVSASAAQCVSELRDEMERLALTPFVHFTGSVADVAPVLAASQVLVSVSRHEGMSLAQLEALACGLRLVATDVGGVAELSAGNPACRRLPVDADSRQFAEAIVESLDQPVAESIEAVARDFDRTVMAEHYRRLYPRAISARRRRGVGLWLVTNNFSTGGAQSSARRLLVEMTRRGYSVRAAVLQEQAEFPTPGTCALRQAGVPVKILPTAGTVSAIDGVRELLAAIDEDPPEAVLFWNALVPYKILIADGLLDVPCFDVSPGEMYFASLERYFRAPLPGLPDRAPRDYGRRLAGVAVKYRGERDAAASLLGAPVVVIPNGVSHVPVEPGPEGGSEPGSGAERAGMHGERGRPVVIGTAARVSPQKKLEELIAALRVAQGRLPEYVCRIAGGVELGAEEYAAWLRREGAGLPIDWAGERTEMESFLRGLDLFAMISEPAGCPNASLEAMAAGVPVVATDWGGVREQVKDGETGLLTARGDAAQLADALVRLATDVSLRRQLGRASQAHVAAHFSLDQMVDGYVRWLGLSSVATGKTDPSYRPC